MIAYIKGRIIQKSAESVVLETGGIGYELLCSASALSSLEGKTEGELYTYMQVREDGISLYGFCSAEEKAMFLKLITVSGVGPKMGIAVLSGMDINSLAAAIASSDIKRLSAIKGLGKKTAERIILELREKVTGAPQSAPSAAPSAVESAFEEDAAVALMTLGFTRAESLRAIEKAKLAGATTLEDIIREALKNV